MTQLVTKIRSKKSGETLVEYDFIADFLCRIGFEADIEFDGKIGLYQVVEFCYALFQDSVNLEIHVIKIR